MLGDIETQRAHFLGELRRRGVFLEREFGMRVDVFVERVEMGIGGIEKVIDRGFRRRHIERRRKRRNRGEQKSVRAAAADFDIVIDNPSTKRTATVLADCIDGSHLPWRRAEFLRNRVDRSARGCVSP